MVSLATRPGASSALTSYNSLRSGRTRLARRALGFGLRTGLAQPLLRNKIDIGYGAEPGIGGVGRGPARGPPTAAVRPRTGCRGD